MYLYLDLIWLLNFCLDLLLLWLTAIFRKIEFKVWRLCSASIIGSSYVLFLFFPPLQSLYTLAIKISLSLVIVAVAFGIGHWQKFLSTFLTFYFVSFVTGGGVLGLHFILQSQHELLNGMVSTQSTGYGDPVSWVFVLVGFTLMFWFSRSRWHQIEKTKRSEHILVDVRVTFDHRIITCRGLIDTGNQLHDPLTKMPVMILEIACLREAIPQQLYDELLHVGEDTGFNLENMHQYPQWAKRLRIIPYRGVQQGMKIMLALKPDQVEIIQNEECYVSTNTLVGLNQQPLSKEDLFQAIVHPDILQNHRKEEAMLSC